MGSLGSKFRKPAQAQLEEEKTTAESKDGRCCKKRKRDSLCDCDGEPEEDVSSESPCKKKVTSTSKYIYKTLFLKGENSDIRICALGRVWNLHNIYLCQSGYFHAMFNGSWKEANMMEINLEIPDQNIDAEALQVVFGSLYRYDVLIKPSKVISIVAAARMFQLDGLLTQCGELMKETISRRTVCVYYSSGCTYGLDSVMKKCFKWLLKNFMTHPSVALMREIEIELMERLIRSPDLFVMQVEMDVYTTLKKWMFLHFNQSWDGPIKQLLPDADAWFSRRATDLCEREPFLETAEGSRFRAAFKSLRFQYMVNDLASTQILERDNIVPPEWLTEIYKRQWLVLLRTELDDCGPQEAKKSELQVNSMRCGRKLCKDGNYCWRWAGFNFGFDLLVTYTNRVLVFKRNTLSQPCGGSVNLQPWWNVIYRVRLVSFNEQGKLLHCCTTGYHILALEKDQEYVVMNLGNQPLTFPLFVCCNFMFTSTAPDLTVLPGLS